MYSGTLLQEQTMLHVPDIAWVCARHSSSQTLLLHLPTRGLRLFTWRMDASSVMSVSAGMSFAGNPEASTVLPFLGHRLLDRLGRLSLDVLNGPAEPETKSLISPG